MNANKNPIVIALIMIICILVLHSVCANTNTGSTVENDETVWWNNTEFSTESYTAPFFEVYKLKDFGNAAYGLATADFDGDGWLDIATDWMTDPWEHLAGISILYGNSDTSFRIEPVNHHNWEMEDLDAADFDSDDDIDIMISKYYGNGKFSINVLWNDNGKFKMETQLANFSKYEGYWSNPHHATADFDLDGDVDFIVGANCGKVKLFKNDGTGNFSDTGVIFDYGDNSWGLDAGDFNNDGYPDFIVCARTNPDEYPFNDPGHIFLKLNDKSEMCFNTSTPGLSITSLPLKSDDTIGKFVFGAVAVLDYNDDGLLDIIYGGDFKIFLFIQQLNGSFVPFYAAGLRDREYTWIDHLAEGGFTVGDFNYDGLDDVVVDGSCGTVRLLINNQTFVNIVKPADRWSYVFRDPNYHMRYPGMKLVIGGIDVIAQGLEQLNRVDFYLDDKLIYSDDSEPYVWNWTKFGFWKYMVIAKAYDIDGQFAGEDIITVWKFL